MAKCVSCQYLPDIQNRRTLRNCQVKRGEMLTRTSDSGFLFLFFLNTIFKLFNKQRDYFNILGIEEVAFIPEQC